MDAELITATKYLDLERRAAHQVQGRVELDQLQLDLARMPRIREKLVFEFLAMAERAFEGGLSPENSALLAMRMSSSVRPENVPLYVASIEKIALRCFELIGKSRESRFALTLVGALANLRRTEKKRFGIVVRELERLCGTSTADPRRKVLAIAKFSDPQRRQAMRRLLRRAEARNIEFVRSAKN